MRFSCINWCSNFDCISLTTRGLVPVDDHNDNDDDNDNDKDKDNDKDNE